MESMPPFDIILKLSPLHLCISSHTFVMSFHIHHLLIHLPADGHENDQNMWE